MSAGFFGKMPGHGDFVERGLPGGFKDAWDEWLQHGIASSKAALGDAWLDSYLTSPVWRFALAAGVCDANPWVGVLVPSVDRVGRYFPLTIAAPIDGNTIPLQMMVAAAEWHDRAQEAALAALHDDRVNADVLVQTLQQLDGCGVFGQAPIYCAPPERDPREAMHAHALRMPFSYGTTPGHGLLAFSHRMLEAFFGQRHSVWWTHGSDRVQPGVFAAPMLPTAEGFAGMLSDQAMAPGWVSLQGYEMGAAQPAAQRQAEPTPTPAPVAAQPPAPAAESLIPEDDDTTLVPGLNAPPAGAAAAGAPPPQASAPSQPERTPEQDPMLGEDPSPTSFDDLIVDAVADDFEGGAQAPGQEPVTGFGLEEDGPETSFQNPPPMASGEEPVPVSSDEILAGFGGAAESTEEPTDEIGESEPTLLTEDTALSTDNVPEAVALGEEIEMTASADPFAAESSEESAGGPRDDADPDLPASDATAAAEETSVREGSAGSAAERVSVDEFQVEDSPTGTPDELDEDAEAEEELRSREETKQ